MFNRPPETTKELADRIMLAPGETKEARFDVWLATQTAEPFFCPRHPRTRLVLDPTRSDVWPARREERFYNGYPYDQPEIEPGAFNFRVRLRCPDCRPAHALCPPEFHQTSFETFAADTKERTEVLARCREFVAQVNQRGCGFMLMVGRNGNGKTRLACNIIRELADGDALYVTQGRLTTALRATYGHKEVILRRAQQRANFDDTESEDDTQPSPLDVTQKVRSLVLDELGCTAPANDERLMLDELIKHRYDHRKPTILISNLPLDKLKEFLGDALTDRTKHATGNGKFLLQFSGESYRRTAGEDYLRPLP